MNIINSHSLDCTHSGIQLTCSDYASLAGYCRPALKQRQIATVLRRPSKTDPLLPLEDEHTFPSPLVLPDDDLAIDPKYPAQSLQKWHSSEERNLVTDERRRIYVVPSPTIGADVGVMKEWFKPASLTKSVSNAESPRPPKPADVMEYLTAFYYGMEVKLLPPSTLTFAAWDTLSRMTTKGARSNLRYVGLNTASECIRIRTRAAKDRVFARQLNLDDLLDAAISILPNDAYALIMLVDYDLYESPEDLFVCGRAYGASRVAVISSARYNPDLDLTQGVERTHAWPASHCETYVVEACCRQSEKPLKKKVKRTHGLGESAKHSNETHATGAVATAVLAHQILPSFNASTPITVINGLWLGRVCRTAAHELGHCFGIDHCVYYACSMQGSSSIQEDARQPPYVCPVDLAKILSATGADPVERYNALASFCKKHSGVHLFDAFRAWLLERLKYLKTE